VVHSQWHIHLVGLVRHGALGLNISNYTLAGVEAAMVAGGPLKPSPEQFKHTSEGLGARSGHGRWWG
jgi:hypothetical protein